MDLIQKALLSKCKLSSTEQDAIPSGDYTVDAIVRVSGSFTKGEDTDKVPTAKVLTLDTFALLFKRMGVTREAAQALLLDVFTQSIELDKDSKAALQDEYGLLEAKKQFSRNVLEKLPRTRVRGAIRGMPTFELVGIVEEVDTETGEVLKRVVS